jgi:branched-chain amino acid transport system permease protein
MIALGFWVIYSTLRFFHLAHGAVYSVGAYAAYSALFFLGALRTGEASPLWAYLLAAIAAMIFASVVGILNDRLAYRPLRKRKASELTMLLASFGVFIFLTNLIALVFGSQILTIRTGPVKEGYHILSAVITPVQILVIVTALSVFLFLSVITRFTRTGKAMRAVADDPITASIVGIDPEKVILFVFVLGSALAGLAGMLVSLETNLEPTMGFNALLKGVIAVIIGGIGNLTGAVLGSLFLGFSENFAVWFLPAGWKDAVTFVVFLLFLLFRPQGILGRKGGGAG